MQMIEGEDDNVLEITSRTWPFLLDELTATLERLAILRWTHGVSQILVARLPYTNSQSQKQLTL